MRITLPHVGESVTEAVIERWLKQVGDRVEKYEPLAEVVTDKVSMEMPSPVDGILIDILVDPGQTIPMGAEIAEIATETDEAAPTEFTAPLQASSPPQPIDRIGTLDKDATNVGPTGSGGPITTGVESRQSTRRGALLPRRPEIGRASRRRSLPRLRDGPQRTSYAERRPDIYRHLKDGGRT